MDFTDFLDSDDEKMENNEAEANTAKYDQTSKAVFSGKQPLFQMPRGWVRKIVTSGTGASLQRNVCYLSPAGQRFSSLEEVQRHFGQAVMPGVFNFDPPQLVDEDDDDDDDGGDDDGEDDEENCSSTTLQQQPPKQPLAAPMS